jgi:hypothetical protein
MSNRTILSIAEIQADNKWHEVKTRCREMGE